MRQLARWYDVDIRYNGTIQQNHFTAMLERSLPLSKVLKLLEATGAVHFSVQDKTIIVSP
jgi:transmembrane sensor